MRIEAEKQEMGDEAWLRGSIRKVDNGVTILSDEQGYQVTMTIKMMMLMNGINRVFFLLIRPKNEKCQITL